MTKEIKRSPIKITNVMKDDRELESLEGIDAPEVLYDILLKDYRARGVVLVPVDYFADDKEDA